MSDYFAACYRKPLISFPRSITHEMRQVFKCTQPCLEAGPLSHSYMRALDFKPSADLQLAQPSILKTPAVGRDARASAIPARAIKGRVKDGRSFLLQEAPWQG